MENIIKKASVLVEAVPYIHQFRRKVFVIKYGGSVLHDDVIRRRILEDIVFLSYVGIRIILIHGGGPHISNRLREIGVEPEFHNGIRVTDEKTLKVVIEELDQINAQIVNEIRELKGDVTSLSGDENLVHVEKKQADRDLGFVGTITSIEKKLLARHLRKGHITVVSPLGISIEQQPHNVNADEVASAIASSMRAEKFVLLTNVPGVLRDPKDPNSLYSTLTVAQVEKLKKEGIIAGGMIPKVDSCVEAVNGGIPKAHIIDARMDRALLLEIFTDTGVGTQILPK
ncbi:MAG: acetylglutamate kinase [Candidatus Omnitrophica bacterium]|nr:acetylglutamate kinase [Candidatus Omnitrophota bacterium]